MRSVRLRHFTFEIIGVSKVAEWWFKSTCGHNSSKKGSRRFFPNVLGDTRKFGSVPIMELEPVAIRSGVYSPCRFESYTLRYAVCPGGEGAVLKTVGCKRLQVQILCTACVVEGCDQWLLLRSENSRKYLC